MTLNTLIFRYMCTKSDAKRDAGLKIPKDVECFTNIRYGAHPKYGLLDIYLPKKVYDKLPVIVNFHGGGWVYGTKETYKYYCMYLARQGFAVVNPSYRLAPRYRFPAAFEDINRVFKYVLKYSGRYGFDTDNIFGVGDSAGATGIAVYACILTNPSLAEKIPVKTPKGLKLKGLGLNCGLYDTQSKINDLREMLPKNEPQKALELLDIKNSITEKFPPCYVMTFNEDFLKDEPVFLLDVLKEKGIPCEYRLYGDEQNKMGHVFHCNIKDKNARMANIDELAFFKKHIK